MVRDLALYGLFVGALFALVLVPTIDDAALPASADFGVPQIEVDGFERVAGSGLPTLRAARAVPTTTGAFTIGGAFDALALREVEVELGDGLVMSAEVGQLAGSVLTLRRRVVVADRLTASAVELRGGRVRFRGVAVFAAAAGRRTTVDLEVSIADLCRQLRQ